MVKNVPSAPSSREKFLYLDQNKTVFYTVGAVAFVALCSGMTLFSLTGGYSLFYLLYTVPLVLYLGFSYYIGFASSPFDFKDFFYKTDRRLSPYTPTVDIYLPSCGENIEIIANTFAYVKRVQDYYRNARVFVLDDAKKKEVETLANAYGYRYMTRPTNELKKAGNLRNAFKFTDGEFILILDADFAVRPEILNDLMAYMHDPNVAIVQTPQFFEVYKDTTWVDKGASFIQELFYRMIQVNRDHFGAAICVGTCALYRRKALEPFGGTAKIAYSEDMHTGFNVLRDGWKVKYIPVNYGKGTCPDNAKAFFLQQYRWCMGSFSLFLNPEFWNSRLTVIQKMCYLTGVFYYITTAFGVFLNLAPAILIVWFAPAHVYWWTVIYSMPSFLFGTVGIALWSKAKWGFYSPATREISYWAHLFAIIDRLTGNKMEWLPTNTIVKVQKWPVFVVFFTTFSVGSYGSLIAGIYLNYPATEFYNFIPMLFFASFYSGIRFFILGSLLVDRFRRPVIA